MTLTHDLDIINVHHHTKYGGPKSNGFQDMNFFLEIWSNDIQTECQTESDAYEPPVHGHR